MVVKDLEGSAAETIAYVHTCREAFHEEMQGLFRNSTAFKSHVVQVNREIFLRVHQLDALWVQIH